LGGPIADSRRYQILLHGVVRKYYFLGVRIVGDKTRAGFDWGIEIDWAVAPIK
jgi:hypothetical protein